MDFSFFLTNNKSGYKTREEWLSKNHPELYNNIIGFTSNSKIEISFKEKILWYFNNQTERPKCLTCQNEIKFRDRFDKPYGDFCSLKCANENKDELIERQKNTFQKKYGVNFYPEHKDFMLKQKNTKKQKYGDENYINVEKQKNTKKQKYGNENYVNTEKHKLTCLLKYGTDNYSKSNNYRKKIFNDFKLKYPKLNIIEVNKNDVKILCNECNEEYNITKQLIYERDKRDYQVCTVCNPIGNGNRSGYEKELSIFLDSLNINYETNKKIGEKKVEIHIFIPEYNLGIEINGLYWHNELFKSKDFHLNKTIECQKHSIELIHIFEDEWVYKQEIVKSILKNRLKLTSNTIYARNCTIKEVSNKDSEQFMLENHIQGKVKSSIRVGLYYQDNLVSLMSFSRGRIIMGGKKDEYELNRFCNKKELNVVGGFSKLLKYFIKKENPDKVVSYSDIRLFNGGIYEKNNFKKITQSKPNYWYVINDLRYYRFNFRKSQLIKEGYDKNKTESEIMFERKIYKIYDCGNIRWEHSIHKK
jgi:hypothetical protein